MNSQSAGGNNSCSCVARTTRSIMSCSVRAFSPVRGRDNRNCTASRWRDGSSSSGWILQTTRSVARGVSSSGSAGGESQFSSSWTSLLPARPPRRGQNGRGSRAAGVPAARNAWRAETETPVPPGAPCPARSAGAATSWCRENRGARATAFQNNPRAPATRAANRGTSRKFSEGPRARRRWFLESDSSRRKSANAP